MKIKSGVSVKYLQPETLFGMLLCEAVFRSINQEMIITSVSDGTHKVGSLHYEGYAFDLRIFHLRGISSYELRDRLIDALGPEYDVILEPSHIHIEYDP